MNPRGKRISAILLLVLSLSVFSLQIRAENSLPREEESGKEPGLAFVNQENIIYGQQQVNPSVRSDTNDTQPQITYKIQGAPDDTYSEQVPSSVGVYTVRVRYPESETCLAAEDTADFTILAYITSVSLDLTQGLPPRVYNGNLQTVGRIPVAFTVEGTSQLPQPGLDYHLEAQLLSPEVDRDPGSLNIRAVLSMREGLYALAPEAETEFFLHGDVVPAPLTIRALDQNARNGFHEDLSQAEAQGLAEGHVLTWLDLTLENGRIQPSNPRITAGDRDVTDQYEIVLESGNFLDRAAIGEFPTAAEDLIYNGSEQALLEKPGKAENGTIVYSLRYHASQSRQEEILSSWSEEMPKGKEPGIYTVYFKALGNGLSDSDEKCVVTVLMPRPLTIHGEGRKIYDGRKELPEGNVTVTMEEDQILPGEEVRIKTISGSSFQQVGVGKHLKIIPGNVVLEGKDAEKYSVKVASFTGSIERRPVSVKAGDAEKAYGQEDPVFSYEAEGLVGHEQLQGYPKREEGQTAGTYMIGQGSLTEEDNPNYAISFTPGYLTIHPAKLSFDLEPSRNHIRPGKTLRLTIRAKNMEKGLMKEGWNQPGSVSLIYGQRLLTMENQSPGLWTAEYLVPRNETGSLRFTALSKDPNYMESGDSVTVKVTSYGSNPDTGDRILFWGTLLFMSALLLAGILIYRIGLHKKK